MRILVMLLVVAGLAAVGCDSLLGTASISTDRPTDEQIQLCRNVMFLEPTVEIVPLGFFRRPDFQYDAIAFKFQAKTNGVENIFVDQQIQADELAGENFAIQPKVAVEESWWTPEDAERFSGNISMLQQAYNRTQELCFAVSQSDQTTLTVFVYARIDP